MYDVQVDSSASPVVMTPIQVLEVAKFSESPFIKKVPTTES